MDSLLKETLEKEAEKYVGSSFERKNDFFAGIKCFEQYVCSIPKDELFDFYLKQKKLLLNAESKDIPWQIERYSLTINLLERLFGEGTFNEGMASTIFDVDGNELKLYRVGKFLITENLKTEHYNDGTPIPVIENADKWKKDTSGAMCYYGNDRKHKEKCGALYNFYAVNTGKLAPKGFRVLSDEDWKQIEIALGMCKEYVDKEGFRGSDISDKMKEVLGVVFTGYRGPSGGGFGGLGTYAIWWSSSVGGTGSWDRQLSTSDTSVLRCVYPRSYGFSVRCVRELTESELADFIDYEM